MTAPIDELLARARLQDGTDTPSDPVRMPRPGTTTAPGRRPSTAAGQAHGHLAAAVPAASAGATAPLGPPGPPGGTAAAAGVGRADGVHQGAARDLRSLCEAVVTARALASLRDFLTRVLPEPPGARVLGCILQLNGAEDSARFWWQYAAGAGDVAASYCLHLHHLSLGERGEAVWWQRQTPGDPGPPGAAEPGLPGAAAEPRLPGAATGPSAAVAVAPDVAAEPGGRPEPGFPPGHPPVRTDRSVPTMLRLLSGLKTAERPVGPHARAGVVRVVMDYVASAVDYVDPDLELPLPCADFTDHIRVLTIPAARAPRSTTPRHPLAVRDAARSEGRAPHTEAG
ncbi:hypothetical protein [Streptomyces aureocirculatus]|uniref:hypothetical protein n=1 Tax=Streptomyces aureocirculatus TaxID=67275 RepID=UPI00068CCF55|nr:hypothetical protein [Streptomyces aureocirculatus]